MKWMTSRSPLGCLAVFGVLKIAPFAAESTNTSSFSLSSAYPECNFGLSLIAEGQCDDVSNTVGTAATARATMAMTAWFAEVMNTTAGIPLWTAPSMHAKESFSSWAMGTVILGITAPNATTTVVTAAHARASMTNTHAD